MVFFKFPGSTQSEPPHQWEGGLLTMYSLPLDTQILNKILFFKPKKDLQGIKAEICEL